MSASLDLASGLNELPTHRPTFWRRARGGPGPVAGTTIVGLIALAAILAPVISPYPPQQQDLYNILSGFSWKHLLGTHELGRDELSRLVYAARTDLRVGVLAIVFPFCFGTFIGTVAGYYGGLV